MIKDYSKDGAVNTIKNYNVRLIPDKRMTDIGMIRLDPKDKQRYVVYLRGNPFSAARRIYEKHHGKIPKDHDVHHVDGDRYNNDINNLIALSKKEHQELHKNMKKAIQSIEIIHLTNSEAKELYKNAKTWRM